MNVENYDCRFFVTYSGVKLPLKLVNPLAEADRKNRNTFFRGYFDAEDRLMLCQKVVYGEIELEHRYRYDDNGTLRQADIFDEAGELTQLNFDETGAFLADNL